MFRAVCLLFFALAFPALSEEQALVKATDFWRVQGVSTNSAEPQPGWTGANYDDSSWPLFQASFVTTFPGGQGTAERTVLPENVATYCFRKTFAVSEPSFVTWLTLRIDYESGFVAYLNGAEIARRGFEASTQPVALGTPAAKHPRGPTELIDVSDARAALQSGTNVLAIQLHSAGTNLPSMLLVTELLANFTRGPFLQNMTTNSVQVIWQTVTPTAGTVAFGKDADHLRVAVVETADTNNVVTLTGLEPGQNYIYRVSVQTETEVAASDWYTFRTLKMPGAPITFVVLGDSGQATLGQYQIADQMKAQSPDLMMHVGDIVYPCFTSQHADARCFSIYRDLMRTTPFFSAQGNHEGYCGLLDYFANFYMPTNSGTESWYSFDHGDAHFVVLATATDLGQRYNFDSPQFKWLEQDLASSPQRWKFIFFHNVIRSSSIHTYDDYLGNLTYDKYELQAYVGSLATKYGVQVIFNGHDHDFERFATFDGYNSFTSGGGGAVLYGRAIQEQGSVQFQTRHNFLKVTVDGPEMKVEATDNQGIVFDRFYRSQQPSGLGPFASSWGSPTVEAASGSDLAGNIPGQTFNLSGNGIPTQAGQRANLGHLHVRNDRDFLYLGLESAAIWGDQVIALFLENPNQPGITDLAPLGNGQVDVDSTGEGADGLDLLTNLTFRNFQPSIGCLLGDEQADHTIRNFKRTNMRWATGQGVFHLDQTFSTIPGARLQQFDRSPQTPVPIYFDENADFIEVAIPLWELGNPQLAGSSNVVKLGAIVYADPASGPTIPVIDTAFAGAALEAGAEGSFVLEPMTIQLSPDPDPTHDGFGFTATLGTDATLHLEWNSVPGASYMIQTTTSVTEPFQDLNVRGFPLTAQGFRSAFNLPIDDTSPRFYRLRAN